MNTNGQRHGAKPNRRQSSHSDDWLTAEPAMSICRRRQPVIRVSHTSSVASSCTPDVTTDTDLTAAAADPTAPTAEWEPGHRGRTKHTTDPAVLTLGLRSTTYEP